ncbi:hypothetical protein DY000_02017914 [Brassica cretica]|uniref:Uncharacterized protein n=1 Tax=Brassica cretica TaxID=69181 RepID=A0ABQ7CY67_BRACR|nr:hypothetical protein DY000_02017914 [Brassica cretica]
MRIEPSVVVGLCHSSNSGVCGGRTGWLGTMRDVFEAIGIFFHRCEREKIGECMGKKQVADENGV